MVPKSVNKRVGLGQVALGARIRQLREVQQLGLSEASTRAGISLIYLSDVERGRRLPTLEVLDAIASSLDTTVLGLLRDLYPWDSTKPPRKSVPPPDGRLRASTTSK